MHGVLKYSKRSFKGLSLEDVDTPEHSTETDHHGFGSSAADLAATATSKAKLAFAKVAAVKPLTIAQHIKTQFSSSRSKSYIRQIFQKMCLFYYCYSFTAWMNIWVVTLALCLYFPLLLPLVMIYTWYICSPKGFQPALDGSWTPKWRKWWLWRQCASYFDCKVHKTAELNPDEPYIFGFHPHGIVAFGGFLGFGTHACGFQKIFPGLDVRILTLNINFTAPILREYLLLHGTCSVDKSACLKLLERKKSIMIAIGGGRESLLAKPRSAELVLKQRKGFVKIALQTGASLVPCYSFGETETFRTLNELPHDSFLRRAQRKLLKLTGFTVPIVIGTGLFLPIGLLPYPVRINVVVGAPIPVEKYEGDVDSAAFHALVDKYHALYVSALTQLYDDHKEKYAKGVPLKIVE